MPRATTVGCLRMARAATVMHDTRSDGWAGGIGCMLVGLCIWLSIPTAERGRLSDDYHHNIIALLIASRRRVVAVWAHWLDWLVDEEDWWCIGLVLQSKATLPPKCFIMMGEQVYKPAPTYLLWRFYLLFSRWRDRCNGKERTLRDECWKHLFVTGSIS